MAGRKISCAWKTITQMKSFLFLTTAVAMIVAGCSSYRGPVWVMRVESTPAGAHIFSGTSDSYQSGAYLGATPCNAAIPAKAGGKIWGRITIWAIPPTNAPGLYTQKTTLGSQLQRSTLPPALFFDLSKPPSTQTKSASSSGG
jgi:hypothetical protein